MSGNAVNTDVNNAAISGAVAGNVGGQVRYLVSQFRKSATFNTEYKLVTLFIGANDICASCNNGFTANDYETRVRAAVESIRTQVPNVIVNVPQLFNVSELFDLTFNDPYCE